MWNATTNSLMSNGFMLADYSREGHQWAGHGHGHVSIIIGIAIVILIIAVVRKFWHGGKMCGHGSSGNALDTLAQRYAKGEIERDEYIEKRDVLKSRK